MARLIQEPDSQNVDDHGDPATVETHPAFAVARVSRSSGTPRTLFQSDLQHPHTVSLTISTAVRTRSIKHDWLHEDRQLVEIEMSEAQWGALVSSIGAGGGVPVTLRAAPGEPLVPGLPYQPRMAENLAETREAVTELLAETRERLAALEAAVEERQGVRAVRDALRNLKATVANAEANSAYAVRTLADAAEQVVSQAKADMEIQLLVTNNLLDGRAISAPHLPPELTEGGPTSNGETS